jgi:6-phosphofructokinase
MAVAAAATAAVTYCITAAYVISQMVATKGNIVVIVLMGRQAGSRCMYEAAVGAEQ